MEGKINYHGDRVTLAFTDSDEIRTLRRNLGLFSFIARRELRHALRLSQEYRGQPVSVEISLNALAAASHHLELEAMRPERADGIEEHEIAESLIADINRIVPAHRLQRDSRDA